MQLFNRGGRGPPTAQDTHLLASYREEEQRRRLQEAAVRSKLQQEIFEARLNASQLNASTLESANAWFAGAGVSRATPVGEVTVMPVDRASGRACLRTALVTFLTLTGIMLIAALVHELIATRDGKGKSLLDVSASHLGLSILQPSDTPHPASDLRTQAAYHKAKVSFHRKQQDEHSAEERFHAAAYFRAVSNANPNGTVGDAFVGVTVDDWCASALYPQQARYFLWRAGRFDDRRPGGAKDAALAVSTVLYEIVFRSTALMKEQSRCTMIGAGHTSELKMVKAITKRLEPLSCRSFIYDQVDKSVASLKGELGDVPSASVKYKGFADVAVSFRGGGAPVTTLDEEVQEIGRGSGSEAHLGMADDLLVIRLDHLEVGELWRRPQFGALLGITDKDKQAEPSARALKGLEKSLLSKRVTAVSWRRDASDTLRNEVDYVAKFGYRVFIVGTDKLIRVDGSYFDAVYTGVPPGGPMKGLRRGPEDAHWLGVCKLSLNLLAVVEGHPYIQRVSRDLSVCVRGDGAGCICDSPPAETPLGSCSASLSNLQGSTKRDGAEKQTQRLGRKWASKAQRQIAERAAKAELDAEAFAAEAARSSPLLATGRGTGPAQPGPAGSTALSSVTGTPLLTTGDYNSSSPLLTKGAMDGAAIGARNVG